MRGVSRRDFLRYLGVGSIGFLARPLFPFALKGNRLQPSDVIQCFDEYATSGSTINESVVQLMMDVSIKTLTGINDIGEAWKSIFPGINENSIISIKVNAAWYPIPTHLEFVNCIVNGLAQMEFGGQNYKKNNIIIWDRSDYELSSSGYSIYDGSDPDTVRCFGTNHSGVGYDYSCPFDIDYPGGTDTKYPSAIMSILSDYLINVAVLKNHSIAQVTLCLKNHYGSINQPLSSQLHYSYCSPSIPSLNQQIRDVIAPNDVQKIFIIDALWGSLISGPTGNPNWNPKKLIMSLDPVACDYQGWNLINEERVATGYSAIQWPVYHIDTASQSPYDLGTTDLNLIEINDPGIEESKTVKPRDVLFKVSPNPLHRKTTIIFSLSCTSPVHLALINPSGRVVSKIYSGLLMQGEHRIDYNVDRRLSAGTYFISFNNSGKTQIKKVTILK